MIFQSFNLFLANLVNPTMLWRTEDICHRVLVNLVQGPRHDGVDPEAGDQEHHHPVEDGQGREQGQGHEPEPEEDVDLLVDDVERKYTETVESLYCSRGSEFVECTFRNLGENLS